MFELNISGELRGHYEKVFDDLQHLMIVKDMDATQLMTMNMNGSDNKNDINIAMGNHSPYLIV